MTEPQAPEPNQQPSFGQPANADPNPVPTPYTQPGYAPRPTNTMAVLALVMAFVFAPLGIVFGAIARKQIAQTGEEGSGLATAGFWLGIALTVLYVLFFVFIIVLIVIGAGMEASNTYSY